jgi:hypothetical protein
MNIPRRQADLRGRKDFHYSVLFLPEIQVFLIGKSVFFQYIIAPFHTFFFPPLEAFPRIFVIPE